MATIDLKFYENTGVAPVDLAGISYTELDGNVANVSDEEWLSIATLLSTHHSLSGHDIYAPTAKFFQNSTDVTKQLKNYLGVSTQPDSESADLTSAGPTWDESLKSGLETFNSWTTDILDFDANIENIVYAAGDIKDLLSNDNDWDFNLTLDIRGRISKLLREGEKEVQKIKEIIAKLDSNIDPADLEGLLAELFTSAEKSKANNMAAVQKVMARNLGPLAEKQRQKGRELASATRSRPSAGSERRKQRINDDLNVIRAGIGGTTELAQMARTEAEANRSVQGIVENLRRSALNVATFDKA